MKLVLLFAQIIFAPISFAALINVSPSGLATMSSFDPGGGLPGIASRGNDGNSNGDWAAGSLFHTGLEFGAWWEVDLGTNYTIAEIVLWNRTDCCVTRANPLIVTIRNSTQNQQFSQGALSFLANTPSMTVPVDVSGRFVRVALDNHTDFLHLAEVQVFVDSSIPEPATFGCILLPLLAIYGYRLRVTTSPSGRQVVSLKCTLQNPQ